MNARSPRRQRRVRRSWPSAACCLIHRRCASRSRNAACTLSSAVRALLASALISSGSTTEHGFQALHARAALLQLCLERVGAVEQAAHGAVAARPLVLPIPGIQQEQNCGKRDKKKINHTSGPQSAAVCRMRSLRKLKRWLFRKSAAPHSLRPHSPVLIDFVQCGTLPSRAPCLRPCQKLSMLGAWCRRDVRSRARLPPGDDAAACDRPGRAGRRRGVSISNSARIELGVRFLQVRVDAALPLTCQRTLETFRAAGADRYAAGLDHATKRTRPGCRKDTNRC